MASPHGFSQDGIQLINAELAKRGINPSAASGAIAGIMGESGSGLDPTAFNTKDPHGGAGGIVQWNGSRLIGDHGMLAYARAQGIDVDPNNPQDARRVPLAIQAQFLGHELDTTYRGVANQLKNTQNPNEALKIWVNQYEVPADKIGAINQRAGYLAPVSAALGTTLTSTPATATAAVAPAVPPPPTFGESIAKGDVGGALKAALTKPKAKEGEAEGKSPLQNLASAFGDDKQQAAPEIPALPQATPVGDPMAGMAPAAQQLFSTVSQASAKPLSWSSSPYGAGAGQIPGTTLNQSYPYG